jgi:hypothetical protein
MAITPVLSIRGFVWRGSWVVDSIYGSGDVIVFGGASYVCLQSHVATALNQPPDANFWSLMIDQGPQGTQGVPGPAGPSNPPVNRLAADLTSSAVALADVTGLSFPVLADKDYLFEFDIIYRSAVVTTGITLAVNGPAAPASLALRTELPTGAATNVVFFITRAYDAPATSPTVDLINVDEFASLRGVFRNGPNAGNLTLRFASEVAGAVVTIKTGSVVRYQQLN